MPERTSIRIARATALVLSAALLFPFVSWLTLLLVLAAVTGAVLAANRVASGKIGGHTGDTIGATQQLAAIAALGALAIGG
jgi:adenosylcobinamide-GDP ribazoletransferase